VTDHGDPLPRPRWTASAARAWPEGPAGNALGRRLPQLNVRLREENSSCTPTCARRAPSCPGGRFDNIDLVVVRENLEGLYIGHEHYVQIEDDPHAVAMATGINTRRAAGTSWNTRSSTPSRSAARR
jgi:isocitrate dehydrogenase (NAD+)